MAEAHSAVAFQFSVTDEGIAFHFDKAAICGVVSSILHIVYNKFFNIKKAFLKGIFPATPLSLLVVTTSVITLYAVNIDPTIGIASLSLPIARSVVCTRTVCYGVYVILYILYPSIVYENTITRCIE